MKRTMLGCWLTSTSVCTSLTRASITPAHHATPRHRVNAAPRHTAPRRGLNLLCPAGLGAEQAGAKGGRRRALDRSHRPDGPLPPRAASSINSHPSPAPRAAPESLPRCMSRARLASRENELLLGCICATQTHHLLHTTRHTISTSRGRQRRATTGGSAAVSREAASRGCCERGVLRRLSHLLDGHVDVVPPAAPHAALGAAPHLLHQLDLVPASRRSEAPTRRQTGDSAGVTPLPGSWAGAGGTGREEGAKR